MQVYISKNNQRFGPFEETKVFEMLRQGQFSPNDFGIRYGENQWQTLRTMFSNDLSLAATQNVNDAVTSKKSKKGLMFGCFGFLLIGVIVFGVLALAGYQNLHPSPTNSEVPETIGKFTKEKLETSSGKLLGGNSRGFTAVYVSNESGKEVRLKYYFHSFNNNAMPMIWEDLKCTGKYENDNRIIYFSEQIGKIYYCNSETPFVEMSFDQYVITLGSDSKDIDQKTLEDMALSFISKKDYKLVPFNQKLSQK